MKSILFYFKPVFAFWLAFSPIINPIQSFTSAPSFCLLCQKAQNAPLFAAPSAQNDQYTAGQNTLLTIDEVAGVLSNDTDSDLDPLTASLVTDAQHGTLALNSDGSFTYDPDTDYIGSDSFIYQAFDGVEYSTETTVTLDVNATPTANTDSYLVLENTTFNQSSPGLLDNDTDPESDPLTAALVNDVTIGSLTLNSDGSFTYQPPADTHGSTSFTYTASDGFSVSSSAVVNLNINGAPDSTTDSYSTDEDQTLNVTSPGVLANDTDPESETLTANLNQNVQHGTLSLNSNGSFTYTPNPGFNGSDSFSYYANDGHQNSNSTTVSITVNATNDPPVAVNDSYSTAEDTQLSVAAPGLLGNDTDPETDPLSAIKVSDPANGTLSLNANGSFTYTPAANFNGSDSFTYKANDGTVDSNIATVTITVTAANDPPVAVNDSYSTAEDTPLTVLVANSILNNDTDLDGNTLTAVKVTDPANGTLSLNANGSFTYTPAANFNGSDSFTYKANDGTVDSNTATVTITVTAANDPPVAVNDSYSTAEDTPLTVLVANSILNNDTDLDGNTLTAVKVTDTTNGTLSLAADGSFTYTPEANYNGSDSFTYKANDGTVDSNIATVTITVTAANDPPVAVNDSYSTAEDTPLTVTAPGLLTNDSDPETDPLSAIKVSDPANGALTLNANGSFTYTPAANFNGSDSFTYKANDGTADSNIATVTITVTAANDPPVAVNDSYSTAEDTPLTVTAPGLLTNDSDPEIDPLSAIKVSDPANGALTLNANGSFTYTPAANFNGSDSFTYKANDGTTDSNTATVTITVSAANDPPVAVNDSYSTAEDTTLTVLVANSILNNDTDLDGDDLSAVKVTDPASGTLSLNTNGSFTYTPTANFNGSDSFTYKANDGTVDSNIATVTITVTAANDPPVAVNDSFSTAEDTTLTVLVANSILNNDTDLDGDDLSAVKVTDPAHGTLSLAADGSFTYTPNANFNGSDSFTYKANDGTVDSNIATVTITVTAANDPPVAVNDSYSTAEDTTLTVLVANSILNNDTDLDGDDLSAVKVTDPASGTLSLNTNGSFTYTPNANFNGSDSFTYKANDGTVDSNTATVTITVTAANDPPVAVNDSYSTAEDTTLTVLVANSILNNDTDLDGNTLTAVKVADPAHGTLSLAADGSFTYTPNANFNGSDSFTYKANDGTADSNIATGTITVTAANDPPVAVSDSYSTAEDTTLTVLVANSILNNDTDLDGDDLSAVKVTDPASGTLSLNTNGSFTYTPNANFNGSDSFTYKANDGTVDSNTATVTITVTAANDPPVAVNDSYSTAEDTTLTVLVANSILNNDTDLDGDDLSAVKVTDPAHGTLSLAGDGSFTYTPTANFNGSDSFTYKANDGTTDSNTATVTITVSAANDPPVAVNDSYSTAEDTTLTVLVANSILNNDTDLDGNTLTAVKVTDPANGTLSLNANGSFTYTPAANFNGSDSFTYKANDGTVDSNTATVTITVSAANDPPVAVNDSYSTTEDTPLTVLVANSILNNDTDLDGNTLTAVKVTDPANGTLSLNPNGSFTYTPAANFNGSDSFTYKANDGTVDSNTATVTITVTAANDPPVAVNDSYSTAEDTPLTVLVANSILNNDTDLDGDDLSAVKVTDPANGTLSLAADGSFTYTPNANFNGSDSFTYKANDGTVDSNTATVTITVTAANDPPVAVNDSYSTAEDTTLTVLVANSILNNDTDLDGDDLSAVKVTDSAHGTLSLAGDGSFTYTPNANFNGSDSFTYKANDGTVDSNTATVTITVTAANDPPVAVNDSYSTAEDTPLTVLVANSILNNDIDLDGNTLTAVKVTDTTNGTLSLAADGSFTYTPEANYNGSDSFTYKANDGTVDSNIATVTITVSAANDPPVAVNDSYSTAEDTPLTVTAPGLLSNDSDLDGDGLTASKVADPAHGSVTVNPNGSFTYTPTANFNGSDSFTYKANDGTVDSNTATVTITISVVNDAPIALDDTFSATEDQSINIPAAEGVLINDSDAEGSELVAIKVTDPAHGTVNLKANGSVVYNPNANFNGTDTFTYMANDGLLNSNIATVTINVSPVNDPPVALNDTFSTAEDTQLIVSAPGLLANDTDIESDPLTAAEVTGPSNGILTLSSDGSFTYTPNANFNGSDSFTYKANDGTTDSNTATVTITVTAINDLPVGVIDTYSTDEDTPLVVDVASGVLANDTDVDGDSLTAIKLTDPTNGSLTILADGSFTYTPAAEFSGSDSFTYNANDGTSDSSSVTVSITISSVNDIPIAVNDNYLVAEDSPLSVTEPGVMQNDSDLDLDPLTVVLDTTTPNGTLALDADGSFIYIPTTNFNGEDAFTYHLNDGTADSEIATVTITITPVNDAPKAYNESFNTLEDTLLTVAAPGILENDTDVDADTLTTILDTNTTNGTLTLNENGSFNYSPSLNFFGSDTFSYHVFDGTVNSNIATTTITINPVNDAPQGTADSYTVLEDNTLSIAEPGVLINDTDIETDSLNVVLNQTTIHGSLTLNSDGSFSYTPNLNYVGTDSFSYRAYDGGLYSGITTVSITVQPVNDRPIAVADTYSASLGSVLTVDAPGVLFNDSDIENDTLTARLLTSPAVGSLTFNSDGSFSYTTDPNSFSTVTFTYEAYDGKLASTSTTVSIQIISSQDIDVNWLEPATNSGFYTAEDEWIQLEAGVSNCDTTCSVRFFRWDPIVGDFVDIQIDNANPYQASIHSKNIYPGWNEFDIVAFDNEGHASQRKHIFVWRNYWSYAPMP